MTELPHRGHLRIIPRNGRLSLLHSLTGECRDLTGFVDPAIVFDESGFGSIEGPGAGRVANLAESMNEGFNRHVAPTPCDT